MKTPPELDRRNNEGVALLVVLVFILLLSVIVIEYAYEAEVEATLGSKRNSDYQAYIAAKSAVAASLDLLNTDLQSQSASNVSSKHSSIQKTSGKTTKDTASIQVDSLTEDWAAGIPAQEFDKSVMQATISDECGKLNLNAIFRQSQNNSPSHDTSDKKKDDSKDPSKENGEKKQDEVQTSNSNVQVDSFLVATLRALFESFNLQEDPTDAILDWLDQDSEPNPQGAESDLYALYDPPYACRNGFMATIEELMLVKGVPPDFFYDCLAGNDTLFETNTSGTSVHSVQTKAATSKLPVILSDLLTVHGDPLGRININTAHPKLLAAMLAATGNNNASSVEAILQAREERPFESIEDLQNRGVLSLSPSQSSKKEDDKTTGDTETVSQGSLLKHIDVKSSTFRIWGDACNADTMVRIEAFVFRVTDEFLAAAGQTAGTQISQQTTPQEDTEKKTTSKKTTRTTTGYPEESFRILDWHVIR